MRVSIVRQSSNIDNLAFQLIFPSRTSASTDKEKVANMYKNYHVWYQQNVVDVYGKTVKLQRTSLQKMEMGGSRLLERRYTCIYYIILKLFCEGYLILLSRIYIEKQSKTTNHRHPKGIDGTMLLK